MPDNQEYKLYEYKIRYNNSYGNSNTMISQQEQEQLSRIVQEQQYEQSLQRQRQRQQQQSLLLLSSSSTPTISPLPHSTSNPFDLITLTIAFVFIMTTFFLCCCCILMVNKIVTKYCPTFAMLSIRTPTTTLISTTNRTSSSDNDDITRQPDYSYKARQMYLNNTLKSHEFRSSNTTTADNVADTSASDIVSSATMNCNKREVLTKVDAMPTTAVTTNTITAITEVETNDNHSDNSNHHDQYSYYNTSQCLICFDPYHVGDLVSTHCSDVTYHRHCIMEWLMKHSNCPYCRQPFFPKAISNESTIGTEPIPTATTMIDAVVPSFSTDSDDESPSPVPQLENEVYDRTTSSTQSRTAYDLDEEVGEIVIR